MKSSRLQNNFLKDNAEAKQTVYIRAKGSLINKILKMKL